MLHTQMRGTYQLAVLGGKVDIGAVPECKSEDVIR